MLNILDWLLRQRVNATLQPTLADWQQGQPPLVFEKPIEQAITGAFLSDRLAYAFFAGYQAALRHLFPHLKPQTTAALAITEAEGTHPKAIQTQLHDGLLTGRKVFVTAAETADLCLIAASIGQDEQGYNQIRLTQVASASPGLQLHPLPPMDFVPEISHSMLTLHQVQPAQIFAGDGYGQYIKPFRTLEDIYVCAAVSAYLFRIATLFHWEQEVRGQILLLLGGLLALAESDPSAAATHITLAGLFSWQKRLLVQCEPLWSQVDSSLAERWRRDQRLLRVAESVREKRLEVAWQHYPHAFP